MAFPEFDAAGNVVLHVTITEEDARALAAAAKLYGLSPETYARRVLFGELKRDAAPPEPEDLPS